MSVPVLVGAGRITQRVDADDLGSDAVDLMSQAVEAALDDAGAPTLRERVDRIAVPRGTWRCTDPARVLAQRIGAPSARTLIAEVGVLQQSLITGACADIASGEIDVAIVCGGEAKHRSVVASKAGIDAPEHPGPEAAPDDVWRPTDEIVTAFEIERGIVMPAVQYSIIGNALAHAADWGQDAYRARLGELWAGYAAVAAQDVLAWDRTAPEATTIVTASDDNRMVSFPYTKLLCSQWNVDQAASLVFASASVARELGVPDDSWVHPVSAAESNAMIPMPQRRDVHRWPAFAIAARAALELAGLEIDDVGLLEIYSCFPSAVQVQLAELGVADGRPLTVTGGMTFGGGPLNNFVIQATAAMAESLRRGEAATGMVTSVSGLLTKPGVAVWSSEPHAAGFRSADVSARAERETAVRPMAGRERGPATIVGATVHHGRNEAPSAVALLELDDATRTVASSDEASAIELVTAGDPVGRRVTVLGPGRWAAG